jgi:hypothetical protein
MTWQGAVKEVKALVWILAAYVGVALASGGGLATSYEIAVFLVKRLPDYVTLGLTLAFFIGGAWAVGAAYEKLRGKKGAAK